MNDHASPLSLIPAHHFAQSGGTGKFAPKLTQEERCAILALVKSGVKRDTIAAAYDLDRRTVGHIVNPQSPRYKEIRNRYRATGHDEFIAEHLTEEVALKIASVASDNSPAEKGNAPSPRANRLAGTHTVKPEQCSYPHRIEIKYRPDGEFGPGWYYRDLDSKEHPDDWFHNGDDSRKTSHACYDEAVANLMDG